MATVLQNLERSYQRAEAFRAAAERDVYRRRDITNRPGFRKKPQGKQLKALKKLKAAEAFHKRMEERASQVAGQIERFKRSRENSINGQA